MSQLTLPDRKCFSVREGSFQPKIEPGGYIVMKKNRWCLRLIVLLVISSVLNLTAALAVEVGSSEDPLVTLSYLNDVFLKLKLKLA